MLDHVSIDRLRHAPTKGFPVLSVYINLPPGPESLRNLPARMKDLLASVTADAELLDREHRRSILADIDALPRDSSRLGVDLGHGVAIFRSSGAGLDEQMALPGPVRDRAILDEAPYLRPLESMIEHFPRYCVAVVGRRLGSIFRFSMGRLETWEEMRAEEIRKSNYGGFAGYEEQRVRARTDEVTAKHFGLVAGRLAELMREEDAFDLLIVGGSDSHVAATIDALASDVFGRLAGSFTIDPGTMTPALVLDHARRVAADREVVEERRFVGDLFDAAASGGNAVLGLEAVCAAVNRRAVDVLFLQADRVTPGSVCEACERISRERDGACSVCGATVHPVPDVIDRLAESVRAAGGRVRHILTEGPLADVEVGARLRYPLEILDAT
ncbi:MAG: hypothetical protein ABFR89_04380 [Actinomycetota bacterium]